MSARRSAVVLLVIWLALAVSGPKPSAAAFTAGQTIAGNSTRVAALRDFFAVSPGAAVRPGTVIAVAAGDTDSLSLGFGVVPSARTFTDVVRIRNASTAAQTAIISISGVPQIVSVAFASGGATAVIAPGATANVEVTTSALVAGRGTGTLRLRLGGSSWLYRDYAVSIDEAPERPPSLTATARAAGRISLDWTASATTTNLAGYDVYRSAGGPRTKLNASPLPGLSYDDTATTDATAYTYTVVSVSTGVTLASLDSPAAAATADATPPARPVSVTLANGGGAGGAYVNAANRSSVAVSVALGAGSLASDRVNVTVSDGARTVTASASATAGAGSVMFSGLDVSSLGDGTITFSAVAADAAGNVSTTTSVTAPKDTIAPAAPSVAYVDNRNPAADALSGTAEANATVSASQTQPAASGPYTTTAVGGSFTLTVAPAKNVTVTYVVTATDAAGNTGPATTLTASAAR